MYPIWEISKEINQSENLGFSNTIHNYTYSLHITLLQKVWLKIIVEPNGFGYQAD